MRKSFWSIVVTCALFVVASVANPAALAQQDDPPREPTTYLDQNLDAESRELPRVALGDLTGFSRDGGSAIVEPGTEVAEQFSYDSLDSSSPDLLDVVRDKPVAHAQGAPVWAVPGSQLATDLFAGNSGPDARVRVENIEAFVVEGGEAWISPGTPDEERIVYEGIHRETNELVGLTRSDARGHVAGTFVQSERWNDGEEETTPEASDSDTGAPPEGANESVGEDTETTPTSSPAETAASDDPTATPNPGEPSSPETTSPDGFVGAVPATDDSAGLGGVAGASASSESGAEATPTPTPSESDALHSESPLGETGTAGDVPEPCDIVNCGIVDEVVGDPCTVAPCDINPTVPPIVDDIISDPCTRVPCIDPTVPPVDECAGNIPRPVLCDPPPPPPSTNLCDYTRIIPATCGNPPPPPPTLPCDPMPGTTGSCLPPPPPPPDVCATADVLNVPVPVLCDPVPPPPPLPSTNLCDYTRIIPATCGNPPPPPPTLPCDPMPGTTGSCVPPPPDVCATADVLNVPVPVLCDPLPPPPTLPCDPMPGTTGSCVPTPPPVDPGCDVKNDPAGCVPPVPDPCQPLQTLGCPLPTPPPVGCDVKNDPAGCVPPVPEPCAAVDEVPCEPPPVPCQTTADPFTVECLGQPLPPPVPDVCQPVQNLLCEPPPPPLIDPGCDLKNDPIGCVQPTDPCEPPRTIGCVPTPPPIMPGCDVTAQPVACVPPTTCTADPQSCVPALPDNCQPNPAACVPPAPRPCEGDATGCLPPAPVVCDGEPTSCLPAPPQGCESDPASCVPPVPTGCDTDPQSCVPEPPAECETDPTTCVPTPPVGCVLMPTACLPGLGPEQPNGLAPAAGTYTNDPTPTLFATYEDPGVAGTTVLDEGYVEFEFTGDGMSLATRVPSISDTPNTVADGQQVSWTVSELASEGAYSWRARGCDEFGCSEWTAARALTLDQTAPPAPSIGSWPEDPFSLAMARWSFESLDAEGGGTPRFDCRLTRDSVLVVEWTLCQSPYEYDVSSSGPGEYEFSVRETDAAGNMSPLQTISATFDPSVPEPPTITRVPNDPTSAPDLMFAFEGGTGPTRECSLVGPAGTVAEFASCNSPMTYSSAGLAQGLYRFDVRSVSAAGVRSATTSAEIGVHLGGDEQEIDDSPYEDEADEADYRVQEFSGERYGGSWQTYGDDQTIHLSVGVAQMTLADKVVVEGFSRDGLVVTAVPVDYSMEQLERFAALVTPTDKSRNFATYVAVENNHVVLEVEDPAGTESDLPAIDLGAEVPADAVVSTWVTSVGFTAWGKETRSTYGPYKGGKRWGRREALNGPHCGTAFTMVLDSGRKTGLTAGHCGGNRINVYSGAHLRAYVGETFRDQTEEIHATVASDTALITIGQNHATRGVFINPNFSRTVEGADRDIRVGETVCMSGAFNGIDCGKVTRRVRDREASWFTWEELWCSKGITRSDKGDSGSPIYRPTWENIVNDESGEMAGGAVAIGVLAGGQTGEFTCFEAIGQAESKLDAAVWEG